jgi:hypothetical protein
MMKFTYMGGMCPASCLYILVSQALKHQEDFSAREGGQLRPCSKPPAVRQPREQQLLVQGARADNSGKQSQHTGGG